MFIDEICERVKKTSSIALGIDPDVELFPTLFANLPNRESILDILFLFSRVAIDAVGDQACAVKFQSAYFEAWGLLGMAALAKSIAYAKDAHLPVILDVKRGDIGSTACGYASAYLGPDTGQRGASDLLADAITLNPYLGQDALEPFLSRAAIHQKGLFILAKTSNGGSGFIQDRICEEEPIFMHVARYIDEASRKAEHMGRSGWSNIGAVVGASYPAQAKTLRQVMPKALFLVPGVGSQGGDLSEVARAVLNHNGQGAIFPISRGLTYSAEQPSSFGAYQEQIKERFKKWSRQAESNC